MATKNLYLKLPVGTCPDGRVSGYRKPNGSVKHVARLFTDKPTMVHEEDANILLEKYPDQIGIWSAEVAKKRSYEKSKLKKKRTLLKRRNMGPLAQPVVKKRKSRELESMEAEGMDVGTTEDKEEIPEDEANSPFNETANIDHSPPADDSDYEPDVEDRAVKAGEEALSATKANAAAPGDEAPPKAKPKAKGKK